MEFMYFFKSYVDSHAVIRNNTERPHILFTQFLPVATSCKTIIQHHNQDIICDLVKIHMISITTNYLMFLAMLTIPLPCPDQPLNYTPYLKFHISRM